MLRLITNIKGPKGDKGSTGDPSTWIRTGTGFPNGVVTAPVGTTYIDTASTSGAQQWIKATGGGSSYGWVVSIGDTGWRDIASLLTTADWAVTGVIPMIVMRRVNTMVDITFRLERVTGSGSRNSPAGLVDNLPTGFRPYTYAPNGLAALTTSPSGLGFTGGLRTTNDLSIGFFTPGGTWATGDFIASQISYRTRDTAWPATLPGIPA